MIGSFFPPTGIGVQRIHTSSYGKCNILGSATLASIVDTGSIVDVAGVDCLELDSPGGLDGWVLSEKGFITVSTDLVQCFFDSAGGAVDVGDIAGFCGGGTNVVHTSTLDGTAEITGGIVDKHRVVGVADGSTTAPLVLEAWNDHCVGSSAPYGNFGSTTLTGEIETEEAEIAVDDVWHDLFNQ